MAEAPMTSERRGGHPQEAVATPIGQCLTAATIGSPRLLFSGSKPAGLIPAKA
jgi:hypothetical protein